MSEEKKEQNTEKPEDIVEESPEKIEGENKEEIDQEKLAEKWTKTAESGEKTVDQDKLAEKRAAELEETEKEKEVTSLEKEKLELLMDIPLEISVEIGSTEMPLEEILKLNPNSIIELDRYINQPVDIKVNGKLIAKGQLYTVENNFGIKITSIITVQERMKLLSEGNT